jgi:hypothetical protein
MKTTQILLNSALALCKGQGFQILSVDSQLTDGGKVVGPTRRLLFIPRKILGTHFCLSL